MSLLTQFQEDKAHKNKKLAVLIDPDFFEEERLERIVQKCQARAVHYILVGGSFLSQNYTDELIQYVRSRVDIPVILFPGNCFQVSPYADAILFMSLISGRNADFLIGQQVMAAPWLEKMDLEILPTGYMLIEGDYLTTAHYISGTFPIPRNKPSLAYATALAGKFLGLKVMYMDTGSGASHTVPLSFVERVSQIPEVPLWVGGGVTHPDQVHQLWQAGADVVVVGTIVEKQPAFLDAFPS